MKNNFLFLSIFLTVFMFISCSSEEENPSENPQNRLVRSEVQSPDLKIEYTYNADELLSTIIGTYQNFGLTSTLVYDNNKRLTQWKEEETGHSTSIQNFSYDNQGRLIQQTLNGTSVSYAYDGNIITATGTIEGHPNATLILEANADGLIIKTTEVDGYTSFSYDARGNMTTAKHFENNGNPQSAYTLTYDSKPNPFKEQFKSLYIERFIEFFYPFEGVFIGGFEGYSFPFLNNNILTISEDGTLDISFEYSYDNEGNPIRVSETTLDGIDTYNITY